MERLYFEIPGIERKADAAAYIGEFLEHGSRINGTGGLDRYLDDYEGWLNKLEDDCTREPNEEKVPARTFFLVRESDRRILGMINIRLALNERLRRYGGHIGYSVRPSERGKGYNKINLYLGLKVCEKAGIKTVFMDADLANPASWRTMEALGGVRIRQYDDNEFAHCTVVDYEIDVERALKEHPEYEEVTLPARGKRTVFAAVDGNTLPAAAAVHSAAWKESHRAFCPEDFVKMHTPKRQEAYLREKMDRGSRVFMLVEDTPVGIVSVTGSLIEDLYVLPECQNRGRGTALLEYAARQCGGVPTLWILENNDGAARLYRRAGFRETGRRKTVTKGLDEIEFARTADPYGGK